VLGVALARSGEQQRALVELQAATAALLDPSVTAGERSAAQVTLLQHILEGYMDLLIELHRPDATERAFLLADAIRGQRVQGAISASAARAAAGDPAVAALVRKEQDLNEQARALYRYLFGQLSLKPEDQSQKVIGDMRKRLDEIAAERKQLQADLQRRFPRYAELVNPRPVTLEQARAALREGEVLVSVLPAQERTYVWAVPKQGTGAFQAAALGERQIERIVMGLRGSLDPGGVALDRMPEFDIAQASRLYNELLKPVEASFKGAQTLIVVANGSLAQLPFGVLPTADATAAEGGLRFERYRQVAWLIKQASIVQLPAVSTLVTLRALPQGNAQRAAFAGFGDPQFGAQHVAAAPVPDTTVTRNLGILRVTETGLREGRAPVAHIAYSALPPLPDTREEILAIAAALNADTTKDVFLGAQASKQNVKGQDLTTRRIVAFATHGLIPGDFPGLDEPALALSAPDGRAETGLLTLSDVLALKLDADWVVLSACNTAAGDGAGAEAISGLGRGFFYAGSRALLVTHWPVETRSARQLVTTLFEKYAADPKLSRAEALRQASLAVMDDTAKDASGKALFSYAHPLFWAPYALVGDGGR
jgi:CHAT domain-containing protein